MEQVLTGAASAAVKTRSSVREILAASLAGTAIEYFDFYLYATAAALVFGSAFFPKGAVGTQQLEALSTFALAYLVRPVGAALFGHFGDRVGRKATLVASLLIMGVSTVLIGSLPTYASIGWWAPAALCLLRCCQGIGFGGEWGGASLLAVENAPTEKQSSYGAVPQIGTLIGGMLANLSFFVLSLNLSRDDFLTWGWRLPFLASAALVVVGLYMRLKLFETAAFAAAMAHKPPERMPFVTMLSHHAKSLVLATCSAIVVFALVYLYGVFIVGYGAKSLGFTRPTMLLFECIALVCGMLSLAIAGVTADRLGRKAVMLAGMAAAGVLAILTGPMLAAHTWACVLGVLCLGFVTLGMVLGPMGAVLSNLFPLAVRYSGISVAYNVAGVLAIAAAAPAIKGLIDLGDGPRLVGLYLAAPAVLGFAAVLLMREI